MTYQLNRALIALRALRDCCPVEGTNPLAYLMGRHAAAVLDGLDATERLERFQAPPAAPAVPSASYLGTPGPSDASQYASDWRDYATSLEEVLGVCKTMTSNFLTALAPGAPQVSASDLRAELEETQAVIEEVLRTNPGGLA